MKRTTHGDNLIQLTRYTAFNCYFVREDDGLTLIDTNMAGSAPAIMAAAEALGQPIKRIVLTHAHVDHAPSVDDLAPLLTGVELLWSSRTERFLNGDLSLDADEPQDELRGGYVTLKTRPTRLIAEGDRVGSLEVIAAPGHTPGHLAFLDTRDGTLVAGDAFATKFGVVVSGKMNLLFPFPALATWHKPTALASAQKLRALNPSRLAVGHGAVIEQPAAALDRAIAQAARAWGQPNQTQTAPTRR